MILRRIVFGLFAVAILAVAAFTMAFPNAGISTIFLAFNNQFVAIDPVPPNSIDRIVVEKSRHAITLFVGDRPVRDYQVALGRGGMEPKRREGDNRVPEGRYTIDWRNPNSGYHRALHISYPDQKDRADAAARGVSPGGDIMIHGIRNRLGWIGGLHRLMDWTAGCVAVTDDEIEEIWALVPDGTPIEIKP